MYSQTIFASKGPLTYVKSDVKKKKYLDLEALDVVIANPNILAVVGIWHLLRGVPSLSGSLRQESTNLERED